VVDDIPKLVYELWKLLDDNLVEGRKQGVSVKEIDVTCSPLLSPRLRPVSPGSTYCSSAAADSTVRHHVKTQSISYSPRKSGRDVNNHPIVPREHYYNGQHFPKSVVWGSVSEFFGKEQAKA
jgi:hypothetical protein